MLNVKFKRNLFLFYHFLFYHFLFTNFLPFTNLFCLLLLICFRLLLRFCKFNRFLCGGLWFFIIFYYVWLWLFFRLLFLLSLHIWLNLLLLRLLRYFWRLRVCFDGRLIFHFEPCKFLEILN